MSVTQASGEVTGAARRWAQALADWAIPRDILAQATQSPWSMPPGLLRADPEPVDTPSRERALQAMPEGGSVLDVGCGAGRAGLALVPPAAEVIGVDVDPAALVLFGEAAGAAPVRHRAIEGVWPDVARHTPVADVVVAHHVAYNAPEMAPFAAALHARARRRIVMELSASHPMSWLAPLWRRFWDLERPAGPTADDALAVLHECGIHPRHEAWTDSSRRGLQVLTPHERVGYVRARLCLPPERDGEIAEALTGIDLDAPRSVVTVWWTPR